MESEKPQVDERMTNAQLAGLITWLHQVVHCNHDGSKDHCSYEICKCATLAVKGLRGAQHD